MTKTKYLIMIENLKDQLRDTDYQAIKYAEGELSAEAYAPVKEQRKELRKQINAYETIISSMG